MTDWYEDHNWYEDVGDLEVMSASDKMRPTYKNVMAFLNKVNSGEFRHQRLGQAFVNTFGHEHCKGHGENNGPCLFHQTNDGLSIRAIWEIVEIHPDSESEKISEQPPKGD